MVCESPYQGQCHGYSLYGMVYGSISAGSDGTGFLRDTAVRPAGGTDDEAGGEDS